MTVEERKIQLQEQWFELKKKLLEKELDEKNKVKEKKSFKIDPLIATIITAIVGITGSAILSYLSNSNNSVLEQRKFEFDMIKKGFEQKEDSSRIRFLKSLITLKVIHDKELASALDSLTNHPEDIPYISPANTITSISADTIPEFQVERITYSQLKFIMPNAPDSNINAFIASFNKYGKQFKIISNRSVAAFLATVGYNTAGLKYFDEKLDYNANTLIHIYPNKFSSLQAATPYAHNPEKLANFIYANKMGNGDDKSGDGWRYRGRGLFFFTFKDMYRELTGLTGIDLVNNPDKLINIDTAMITACAYWQKKGLNRYSDEKDFIRIWRITYGGSPGSAVLEYFRKAQQEFQVK